METGESLKSITQIPGGLSGISPKKSDTLQETYSPIGTYLEEFDKMASGEGQSKSSDELDSSVMKKKKVTFKEELQDNKEDVDVFKKKMTSKERKGWTADKEDLLCELWEEADLLYDRAHEEHNNPVERSAAEHRIAEVLNIDGTCMSLYAIFFTFIKMLQGMYK